MFANLFGFGVLTHVDGRGGEMEVGYCFDGESPSIERLGNTPFGDFFLFFPVELLLLFLGPMAKG